MLKYFYSNWHKICSFLQKETDTLSSLATQNILGDKMIKIKSNEKGFTLIELMIVIAIIGMLTGVAFVYYQWQLQKAKNSEAEQNVINVRNACESCWVRPGNYDQCSLDDDLMTGETKLWCVNSATLTKVIAYKISSPYIYFEMNPNPLEQNAVFSLKSFHNQGTETFCYTNEDGYGQLTRLTGKNAVCP